MSLPDSWVEKLHRKLSATYGQAFLRQYDGVPWADVKANWADELACFQKNPEFIRRGLDLLPPERAPTVLQFRDLCKSSPPSSFTALPAPTADPVSPEVVAATRAALKKTGGAGSRDWALVLKERESRGPGLSRFQRDAWRTALREDQPVAA